MADQVWYLVRHAIAEPRGDAWPDDHLRPLSQAGRRRMRRAVEGLAELDVRIDVLLTSPLVRAKETADLLAAGLRPRSAVVEVEALAPGHTPGALAAALRPYGQSGALAIVGHEPELGQFAAWLLELATPFPFRKGAVCRIDVAGWPPKARGQLVWLATPKMLRAMRPEPAP